MPKRKLTDPFIKNHNPPEKQTEIYDSLVSGMAIRLTPNGKKVFVLRYWFDGMSKRFTIGQYPDWSLAQAREKSTELKRSISEGLDPMEEKRKQKQAVSPITFKKLAKKFKDIYLPSLREKTIEEHTRIIDNELVPAFGNHPAKELTRRQIIAFLDKKAIANGKPTMANRIRARLHSIYEFGIDKDIVESNPVTRVKSYPEGSGRERFYSEKEIRNLWKAFGQVAEPAGSLMKMLLLTGQRKTETMNMMWGNIHNETRKNFKGLVWIIPKDLAKSDRAHLVPVNPLAKEILGQIRKLNGEKKYVFASPVLRDSPISDISRSIKEVRELSKVEDFKLHDLRRTVSTYLAELGVSQEVNSKILNHKTGGGGSQITRLYNRYEYIKERQIALNKWADKLHTIITAKEERPKIFKIN